MGYWSYTLFGNDTDADQLCELASEAGVERLDYPDDKNLVSVRKKLDSGVLKRMLTKYKNPNRKGDTYMEVAPYGSKHHSVCILAAAAMTTGAYFDQEDLEHLKAVYKEAGLFDVGAGQFGEALERYKNDGMPWNFDKSKWCEVDEKKCDAEIKENSKGSGMMLMNVYPEGTFEHVLQQGNVAMAKEQYEKRKEQEDIAHKIQQLMQGQMPAAIVEQTHCAGHFCFKKKKDNLFACGKCRIVKYCGRDCQAKDWKQHKSTCNALVILQRTQDAAQKNAPNSEAVY